MRTETEKQAATDLGITHYRNVAVLDLKTSEICQHEDRKIYPYAEQARGINAPPFHPWCRTITQDVFDDVDLSKLERIARNPETGQTEYVPADMTYPEWIKRKREKHGNTQVDTWIKQKKNENRDRVQHQQYRQLLGEEVPKSFADFQKIKYNDSEKYSFVKSKVNMYRRAEKHGILPNAQAAMIDDSKLTGYLLNPLSPNGKSKADLIEKILGYNQSNYTELKLQIQKEILKSPPINSRVTEYGHRYTVPIIVLGKNDRYLKLNTVWQRDNDSDLYRFITTTFDKKKKR